jgi:hypothetical protein
MELIYNLFTIIAHHFSFLGGIFFYYKFSFILLLFIINIYLIITHKPNKILSLEEKHPILQAGFNNKKLKGWLGTLGAVGGFLSAFITVKIEIRDINIGRLDQLMAEDRENIRRSIDKDKEEHQNLFNSIIKYREEVNKLQIEKAKIYGHNERLQTLQDSMKEKIASYQNKSINPDTKLSELGIIDQLIKRDTNKFNLEVNSLISDLEISENPSISTEQIEIETTDNTSDLKESSIFDFNIFYYLDWFEGLNGIKKTAVSLILGKSVIFSALLSIIFIFYGDILIKKYDLEKKYPKLAHLIQLRREFQKYYFKYNCLLILIVIITEVTFAVAILLL